MVRTERGDIERDVTSLLDVRQHLCEVRYSLRGSGTAATEETHVVRYFFPMELEMYLETAGFRTLRIAVKVALESKEGSYLRRFSWPDFPGGLDLADVRPQAEVIRPLGHLLFVSSLADSSAGDETTSAAAAHANMVTP